MKRNLVLVSLCILFGTVVASAQTVVFNVGTAPTFVANTGRAEVLGQVTNTGDATCGTNADGFCVSTAGTIQVLYQGVAIDNAIATANLGTVLTNGIEVCEIIAAVQTCNAAGTYISGPFTVTNTTAGGVVSFGVLGVVDFAAGDQVVVRGARGRIDQSAASVPGTDIRAKLTASPSTIASFQPTSEVVATSADPLTIAFAPMTLLQCLPTIGTATVTVTEGFNIAFVDHDDANEVTWPATTNPRPLFIGADARVVSNSQINIVLTGLPTGVTVAWPAVSAADSGTGATGAVLDLVSQSTSGDTATYVFSTPDQAVSDINGEIFVITLTAAANITLTGTTADFGTALGQGQMWPGVAAAPSQAGPEVRYNHPLENVPADPFIIVGPCTTNLLFPWVANVAGYDTGLAIANTTDDPYGTLAQAGTCTIYGYPVGVVTNRTSNNVSLTTSSIGSGDTFTMVMSSASNAAFNGWAGYIIAICRFQYGHGFAYITDNFGVAAPATAQGYVALIIPDPILLLGRSAAVSADDFIFGAPPYGEGLAQ